MLTLCSVELNVTNDAGRIYRAKILFALEKDLLEELEWLNGVSLTYLKNYQIWYIHPHPKLRHTNSSNIRQAPPPSPHVQQNPLPHPPPQRTLLPNGNVRPRLQKLPRLDLPPLARPSLQALGPPRRTRRRRVPHRRRRPQQLRLEPPLHATLRASR